MQDLYECLIDLYLIKDQDQDKDLDPDSDPDPDLDLYLFFNPLMFMIFSIFH